MKNSKVPNAAGDCWALYEDEASPGFLWSMGVGDQRKAIEEVASLKKELFSIVDDSQLEYSLKIGGVYLSPNDFWKGCLAYLWGMVSPRIVALGRPCAPTHVIVGYDLKRGKAV